jgi:hypothetical protein
MLTTSTRPLTTRATWRKSGNPEFSSNKTREVFSFKTLPTWSSGPTAHWQSINILGIPEYCYQMSFVHLSFIYSTLIINVLVEVQNVWYWHPILKNACAML